MNQENCLTKNRPLNKEAIIQNIITNIDREYNQEIITRSVAAKILCVSPRTLANWDSQGKGIKPLMKLGNKRVYEKKAFLEFYKKRLQVLGPESKDRKKEVS